MVKITDLKFDSRSFSRWTKRQKFQVGTQQFQLAWRIERNLKADEEAKAAGMDHQSTREHILKELGELRELMS